MTATYDIQAIRDYRQMKLAGQTAQQSLLSRGQAAIAAAVRSLLAPGSRPAVVDLSEFNIMVQADFDGLKAAGVVAVIIRFSSGAGYLDPRAAVYVAMARRSGLMVGGYHWYDPTIPVTPQETFFGSLIAKFAPDFVGLDVEQWWLDWDAWYAALMGKLDWSKVAKLAGATISNGAQQFMTFLKSKWRALLYTEAYVVQEYSPQMSAWIGTVDCWIASYIKLALVPHTWADIWIVISNLGAGPLLPAGLKQAALWQFSSGFGEPGNSGRLDWSVDLVGWLTGAAVPQPAPPPAPTNVYQLKPVYIYGYFTRTGQGGSIVKWEPAGWSPSVTTVLAGWGQTKDGWINLSYFNKQ